MIQVEMIEEINEITRRRRELEKKLEIFGLVNLENVSKLSADENELRELELEMELCDQKLIIYKMKVQSKHLNENINKSMRSIELLKECLKTRIDVTEMGKAAQKREFCIQKLSNKEFKEDNPILKMVHKLKELDDITNL